MKPLHRILLGSALLMGGLNCTSTHGAPMTFTVDPTQSSLSIEASLNAPLVGSVPLVEQGSGSLLTTYGGTVEADVTDTTVQFSGGSSIVASNSGSWQPGPGGTDGTAPANYGGQGNASLPPFASISVKAAMRDIVVDATSGLLAVTGDMFPAGDLVFGFDANANSVLDYSYSGTVSGSGGYTLTGLSTNGIGLVGTITTVGNELVLTIPVNYTGRGWIISQDDLTYTLTGQLVAKASANTPPLVLGLKDVTPTQFTITMNTVVGEHYTILGRTSLTDAGTMVDEFTATEDPTTRIINLPIQQQQFFQARQD